MNVTVFGVGYVGLVTGVCLAEIGHNVLCVDIDAAKIDLINSGKVPIYEPGLEELLRKNLHLDNLAFSTDLAAGVQHGDYIFIAVGTPSSADGSADLHYVYEVAHGIGRYLAKPTTVINKSTVPVGTAKKVQNIIDKELRKRAVEVEFSIASNPEFLKQGDAIRDFMHSDRVIIGVETDEVFHKIAAIYQPLGVKIVKMDLCSAELSKYAANAFLATKISFINEIAQFAEKFGANIENIREGIGSDSRIGYDFLRAGCGYGGSCFPKDVSALIWMAREYGIETPLFNAVEGINSRQKHLLFNRLKRYFLDLDGKVIALWGLSFKPNTDDMREAPSRVLMEALWREGAKIQAYDPVANKEAEKLYGHKGSSLSLFDNRDDALVGADALLIVTEWPEFAKPDFALIKHRLQTPLVLDGRNLLDAYQARAAGLEYYSIGRL